MRLPLNKWFDLPRGYKQGDKTFYSDFHLGVDIITKTGLKVYAPEAGTVTTGTGKQGGKTVILNSGNFIYRFLHLDRFGEVGRVKEGDVIGYTGNTGLSTTPHLHHDIWLDKINPNTREGIVDPEKHYRNSMNPIRVLLLSPRKYDLKDKIRDFKRMGVFLEVDYVRFRKKPEWVGEGKKARVSGVWWDLNVAPLASGYDMVALVCDDYQWVGTNGYAMKKQRHGLWHCFIEATGKNRRYGKSKWNGPNQVAGTFAHEIAHLLHSATRAKDKTHELDKSGRTLEMRWNLKKFKGWKVRDGYMRIFKWSEYMKLTSDGRGKLVNKKFKSKLLKSRVVPRALGRIMLKKWHETIPKHK